jgi:SAM-dependent methyltransferase
MNRKARRAALKGGSSSAGSAAYCPTDIDRLAADAGRLFREGRFELAQESCRQILGREPCHVIGNSLTGLVCQAFGRDAIAVKHFATAIASDEKNASVHYNIAISYQRLNRWNDAVAHFKRAIALKMDGMAVEGFITQNPVIHSCLGRIAAQWPRRLTIEALFGAAGAKAAADDALLRCALENVRLNSPDLEFFLTSVRHALLQVATRAAPEFGGIEDKVLGLYAALAQQCFINEYVYDQSADEILQAEGLRNLLLERATAGGVIPPLLLVTVAAYFPLHALAAAALLRDHDWPPLLSGLIRQQLFEPYEEAELRRTTPSLTAIEDSVSVKVKRQYEENPFPRWTLIPDISTLDDWRTRFSVVPDESGPGPSDILIAGCGTGQHSIEAALMFPAARVLAVDLSAASLAYATRKTREAAIQNIEHAAADILELGSIGRSFDRIEAVGVLHHLADPRAGWRVLLSLLRPGGVMDIGLYSEAGRRSVVAARAVIAERGYRATTDDIRRFRQDVHLTNHSFAKDLLTSADFYTTSACRDLLFHVMEHRFNIPDIATFLSENGLSFLGFRLLPQVADQFRSQFPDPAAPTNLDCWQAFEQAHPQTFAAMYRFSIRKNR